MTKTETKYNYRVGIYLRLSSEDKDKVNKEDRSESIKNQRNMLIDYIDKNPNFVFVKEYCDEDLSGAGTYRPEFERMIEDCENKKIDIVLCKSQSRFSRDMEIVEKYINNKFKEWNIRFIGLTDSADTHNFGNKKSRQINGLVNEWYLEDVSNNIRSAFYSKMKQGEFISPFAPFGYEISTENNNKLLIDPVASIIVKKVFDLYLEGLGFTTIAKYLNDRNIPSPSLYKKQKGIKLNIVSNRSREDIKWSATAVKTILNNEIYLGHLIQGKRTTVSYKNHKTIKKDDSKWIRKEHTHKAIIDDETFYKVQKNMKERTKPIKNTGIVHNLSGKIFCLECGHHMRKKNSSKHQYLVCSSNCGGYDDCANKASIRYDIVENIILNQINRLISAFYDENLLSKEALKSNKFTFLDKISVLENHKNTIKEKISKNKSYLRLLYEDKVNKIITNQQFKDLISIYNKNEINLMNEFKLINNEIKCFKLKSNNKYYLNLFSNYKIVKSLNRIIVEEFINKISISKINKINSVRNIQIYWNF